MKQLALSRELLRASWAVMKQDRELLLLPIMSLISAAVTIALYLVPFVMLVRADNDVATTGAAEDPSIPPVAYALFFMAYVSVTFVAVFFNAALVHGANERMEGRNPTLGSCLEAAGRNAGRILAWSVIVGLVSMIIQAVEDKLGLLGKFLGFLAATAWTVASFLVLPVLVLEGVGPRQALDRSVQLIRQSWGEGLAGHIGLWLIGLLWTLGLAFVGGLLFLADPELFLWSTPLFGVVFAGIVITLWALSTVFRTALYRHASGLPVPEFHPAVLEHGFRRKGF